MTLGDKVGDPVAVTERTESIDVEIAGNYTENERNIVVEMADAGAEPQWTKIVEARQEAALVLTAGFYWAKGNVTLMDGKFAVADKMSDLGLYFRQAANTACRRKAVRTPERPIRPKPCRWRWPTSLTASRIPIRAR